MSIKPDKLVVSNDFKEFSPPFCYRYRLELIFNSTLQAKIEIQYYGREELEPEEINAEGFSEDDDFQWNGEIDNVWKKEVYDLLEKAKPGKNKGDFQLRVFENEKVQDLIPKNVDQFEYLVQEIIQGIYEVSGKQEELLIILKNQQRHQNEQYELKVSFHKRQAILIKDNLSKNIEWNTSQQKMKQLYSFPMDSFTTHERVPKKKGVFINLGDGYWYEAGISILPQKNKEEAENKILSLFENL